MTQQPIKRNQPAGRVVSVTMLGEFFPRFEAWAQSQGFLVTNVPGESKDDYIVVPGPELMEQ